MTLVRVCVLAPILGSACTVAPPRNLTLAAASSQDPEPPTQPAQRVLLEGSAIPIARLTLDFDGLADDSRSEDATGWGVRAGFGDRERSAGLLFQSFRSDDGLLDADVVSFDFDVRTSLESEVPMMYLRAGASVGFAWLDTRGLESNSELSTQLRLGFDVQPSAWLHVNADLGGILFGSPGETAGYGTFFSIGAALVF